MGLTPDPWKSFWLVGAAVLRAALILSVLRSLPLPQLTYRPTQPVSSGAGGFAARRPLWRRALRLTPHHHPNRRWKVRLVS